MIKGARFGRGGGDVCQQLYKESVVVVMLPSGSETVVEELLFEDHTRPIDYTVPWNPRHVKS